MQQAAFSENDLNLAPSISDWVMLHQLTAKYWSRVDRTSDRPVHELYTEDGEMLIGTLEKRGQAEIAQFFADREIAEATVGRRTRHIMSGFFVEADGLDAAILRSTILVFAGVGELPLASAPPSSIGDFIDRCVRCSDGNWRFAQRHGRIVFAGANAAPFAR